VALKLKPSFETDVYVTEGGYVAIQQPDPDDDTKLVSVLLSADQLRDIILELQTLEDDRKSWEFGSRAESDDHDSRPSVPPNGATA
jgi:hypothetical protein